MENRSSSMSRIVGLPALCLSISFGFMQEALAIGGPSLTAAPTETSPNGNCSFFANYIAGISLALVRFTDENSLNYVPSGAFYSNANVITTSPSITITALDGCGWENIRNLDQNGADGNYAADDFIGVSFRAEDETDGETYDYVFSLVGATATTAVFSRTLVSTGSGSDGEPEDEDLVVEETQKLISEFQNTRINNLVSQQPNLTSLLSGTGVGSLNAAVTQSRGTLNFATNPNLPVWARLSGVRSEAGSVESTYAFGAVGGHVFVNPGFIVGGMLQFDYLEQDEDDSDISGQGWMLGPYFVAKHPDQPLFFEGRLLYGQSENEISPFDTYTDDFETERFLAQVKISGMIAQGQTNWIPSLGLTYASDRVAAYRDTPGNKLPEQEIELSQLELGFGFDTPAPFVPNSADVRLTGGITAIGSYIEQSGDGDTIEPDYEGGRARLDLGMRYAVGGGQFVIETFYDGIGADDYEAYGALLGVDLQF